MTDWLGFARACVADIDDALTRLPSRLEREPVLRPGEGGDDTTAIDAAAEEAIVARLEALGGDFTPRLGGARRAVVRQRRPAAGGRRPDRRLRQLQARHPVLLAVARGRGGADDGRRDLRLRVRLRHARGVGRRERGVGVRLDGAPLDAPPPKEPVEILSFEGTTTDFDRHGGAGHARRRPAGARDGLARAVALPPRSRPRRRGVLAEAGPLDRHRRRAARRPRARLRDRAVRVAALRRRSARPGSALTASSRARPQPSARDLAAALAG